MDQLQQIFGQIRQRLEAVNQARDEALAHSRELTRLCANSIRATHRLEW
ncbi:MAG: haloacid dehalogenase, partial [Chloroflexi bacterium]|nr:haloacid dehalogenase [Chloroflexota bacterium]